jgi:hypothetical protein
MTRQLVCEGACNPALPSLDADGRQYRLKTAPVSGSKAIPIDSWLASELRTLKHTPHRLVTEELARCEVCHGSRRHGKVS